jgi:hypothetical protein
MLLAMLNPVMQWHRTQKLSRITGTTDEVPQTKIYHNRQWNNAMLLSANEYCSQHNGNMDNLNATWFSAAAYIFELGLLH